MVRNVISGTPDNSTLVLNWQPPDPTNGDILNYIVRITLNFNDKNIIVAEEVVTNTTFIATNLGKSKHFSVVASYDNITSKFQEFHMMSALFQ